MAAGIFNPENDFWRLIEKLVDLFPVSYTHLTLPTIA